MIPKRVPMSRKKGAIPMRDQLQFEYGNERFDTARSKNRRQESFKLSFYLVFLNREGRFSWKFSLRTVAPIYDF